MVGARRPAASATSVKRARNGMPDGLPRGEGFTTLVAVPWAARRTAPSENGKLPVSWRRLRRDRFTGAKLKRSNRPLRVTLRPRILRFTPPVNRIGRSLDQGKATGQLWRDTTYKPARYGRTCTSLNVFVTC